MIPNWISISLNSSTITSNFTCNFSSCTFYYPCPTVDSCFPYLLSLQSGKYLLKVWGAEGGGKHGFGGKGGYTRGSLSLYYPHKLFLYLGSKGEHICDIYTVTNVSYNGGGNGITAENPGHCSGSGGGGSDFRLSSFMSSRILVAGGGGGEASSTLFDDLNKGGFGGGEFAGNGECIHSSSYLGSGANISGPGLLYFPGKFGFGGNSVMVTSGGGGGGWYGGGAGNGNRASGGGGSGYFYSKDTLSSQNQGLNSNYYIESGLLLSGYDTLPNPDGSNVIGHFGSGVGRITLISLIESSNYFIPNTSFVQKIVLLFINVFLSSAFYISKNKSMG